MGEIRQRVNNGPKKVSTSHIEIFLIFQKMQRIGKENDVSKEKKTSVCIYKEESNPSDRKVITDSEILKQLL